MTRMSLAGRIAAFALPLMSCASGPQISTEGVNEAITPRQATAEMESLRGEEVLWGGTIVNSTNLEEATRLEILAYALDSSQRPNTSVEPNGRFLAVEEGYLETMDYSPGRLVTVKGTLIGTREGSIGEAEYTYPVVQIDQLYLWPEEQAVGRGSGINFGFGIGVIF
jgi:outer membrane lipoprotein